MMKKPKGYVYRINITQMEGGYVLNGPFNGLNLIKLLITFT